MATSNTLRIEDLYHLSLPPHSPRPAGSHFHEIQELLLDFGSQVRIQCDTSDEAMSLINAANAILIPLRSRIMMLVMNSAELTPEHQELIQLYNLVWDKVMSVEYRHKIVRLLVLDIDLDDDRIPSSSF